MNDQTEASTLAEDELELRRMGYSQELRRNVSGFSNFAVSFSIICILAGGVTSFSVGFCSVGGAAIGLGWPLVSLFALLVALTMGQLASAFPTAGGLYHWAAILGGKGWGWAVAWFNLAGLVTALAAVNLGLYEFLVAALGERIGLDPKSVPEVQQSLLKIAAVTLLTVSQALFNHFGIRLATRLTDTSGYWIMILTVVLVVVLLAGAASYLDPERLTRFDNFSGLPNGVDEKPVQHPTDNLFKLFLLGLLLPAYTLTGYDASAHIAEETIGATNHVPRAIVRAVIVSGLFGWVFLAAVVLAAPDLRAAAEQGDGAFVYIVSGAAGRWAAPLYAGIALAQYVCGLATITSASRMAFAFARDGGLPFSTALRRVHPDYATPVVAIWIVAAFTIVCTLGVSYATIAAVCSVYLYLSYVLPIALGLMAHGRSWTTMGPWNLGGWYRPLACLCVAWCVLLLVIAVQPPNEQALWIVPGSLALLAAVWFGFARRRFRGPPSGVLDRNSERFSGIKQTKMI
jgi:amino acid transporter